MDKLRKELGKRRGLLLEHIRTARKVLKHPVDGSLEVNEYRENRFKYLIHEVIDGKRIRRYLNRANLDTAKRIAARDYAKMIKEEAEMELSLIEKYLESYDVDKYELIYSRMKAGRRALVEPLFVTREEFVQRWIAEDNGMNNTYPIESDLWSEKGEEMRSKSEKMIADKLFSLGIPYKYEYALVLDGKTLFPDFTVLNPETRKVFIWEHLGTVDDAEYMERTVEKLRKYERNGYIPGVNLILTYETKDMPLSTTLLNAMVEKILND